jgi:hypothetical protein
MPPGSSRYRCRLAVCGAAILAALLAAVKLNRGQRGDSEFLRHEGRFEPPRGELRARAAKPKACSSVARAPLSRCRAGP